MKEIIVVASNVQAAAQDDKTFRPMVELIVISSEPHYSFDETGRLAKSRRCYQDRFMASPDALRNMSKTLSELADEAELLVEPLTKKPRPQEKP